MKSKNSGEIYQNEGVHILGQECNRNLQLLSLGSGFRMKDVRKELWRLYYVPLWLRKEAEAKLMMGEPLIEGPERLLCKCVKVKPRSQDVENARHVECLPRKAVDYMWNHPKGKKYIAAKRSWRFEKHPIIMHGNAQFRVCPAVFQLLVQYSFYAIPPFVHPLSYMLNICYLSFILIL